MADACQFAACLQTAHCRGLCRTHYTRWRRQGSPADLAAWIASGGHALKSCAVCAKSYPAHRAGLTCSVDCRRKRRQQRWREQYYALPPEKKRAMMERHKQKRRQDPDWAHRVDARKYARIKADPDRLVEARAKAREHYAEHAAEIQARRRAMRLDPDQGGILVGRAFVPVADLVEALAALAGSAESDEDDDARSQTLAIPLTRAEHASIKKHAGAESMSKLARNALRVAGLI